MATARKGFTLVELLVALTLIAVGAAAWVGTSVAALQLATAADRQDRARLAARAAVAGLAPAACTGGDSGRTEMDRWQVDGSGALRRIVVTRRFAAGARVRELVVEAAVACR